MCLKSKYTGVNQLNKLGTDFYLAYFAQLMHEMV